MAYNYTGQVCVCNLNRQHMTFWCTQSALTKVSSIQSKNKIKLVINSGRRKILEKLYNVVYSTGVRSCFSLVLKAIAESVLKGHPLSKKHKNSIPETFTCLLLQKKYFKDIHKNDWCWWRLWCLQTYSQTRKQSDSIELTLGTVTRILQEARQWKWCFNCLAFEKWLKWAKKVSEETSKSPLTTVECFTHLHGHKTDLASIGLGITSQNVLHLSCWKGF